ncbi:MAG: hypothetical protein ACOYJ1_03420 [Peptococcales bacterium]
MAKYNFKCKKCLGKFTIEVTQDIKPKQVCPHCGSQEIKVDYEQPEMPDKFEKDNIHIFCAMK